MPVTATAAGVLLGSLLLVVSVQASDAPDSSPDASVAITDRLARLEEEMAMLSAEAPSCDPEPDLSCCCCPPHGWFTAVDWINWQVRQRERFLILGDSGNPFFPSGVDQPLEFNRATGLRASLGYQFVRGWQLAFIYSYLRPHGEEITSRVISDDVTGRFQRSVDLDYDVFDLQALRPFDLSPDLSLSVFGGIRWASLNQQSLSRSESLTAGVLTSFDQTVTAADTDATGIRVGGTANWECCGGVSLFGSAAGSVLVQNSNRTLARSSSVSPTNPLDSDSSTDGLPILETAAGVAWVCGRFSIKAGYELATWFNVTEVGFVPATGLQNQTQNLTFDGAFIRLEVLL